MKKIIAILLLLLTQLPVVAQEKYSRVKIYTGRDGIQKLARSGIETDHGLFRPNVWFITELSESEIQKVRATGLPLEILIDDVKAYFQMRNREPAPPKNSGSTYLCVPPSPYTTPANFSLGSMGGHLTYQEMINHLDNMHNQYPGLITVKAPLHPVLTTIEGRPVYYVKISDNPTVNEQEPQVLYTAIHHAREPVSMHQLIFFMWYLLENYASDSLIQQLVNNTELYFIPCLNPDGYIYNETTDPQGGGMWRKNRRLNLDGSYGVDLNRNYGFLWGFDDIGSSPFGPDQTYRGTAPFSEPESQMIRDFVNAHNFRIALNAHTFGNLLIHPWGYLPNHHTPDSALYLHFGTLLTEQNGYTSGTANQTVGYVVNGSSDDWMYGEQATKPKIFAMTPETGSWFWPSQFEIEDLCKGILHQNLMAALLAGPFARVKEHSPLYLTSTSGHLVFTLTQSGLDTSATYTVSLIPISSNIISCGPSKQFSNLSLLQTVNDSISFTLSATNLAYGDQVTFALTVHNGLYTWSDTVKKIFGIPQPIYFSAFNSVAGWTPFSGWGITSQHFYSPPTSMTDSPNGNYPSNSFSMLTQNASVNLQNAIHASLTFYARWAIEPNYDFAQVQITTDNGTTWIPLCGKYTVEGTTYQAPGEPVYEGFQNTWVKELIDLTPYIGHNIRLRFVLMSDAYEEHDGFYFDNLEIVQILPGGVTISEQIPASFSFHVFPNPADRIITFSLSHTQNSHLIVTDIMGRILFSISFDSGTQTKSLNLEPLENSIYFYQLIQGSSILKRGTFAVIR